MRISSPIMIPKQQIWRAGRERSLEILGRKLPVKQTIVWAAAGSSGILKLGKLANRLLLVECNHLGQALTDRRVYRALKFLNSDLQVDIPHRVICRAAREWLDKAGENLILNLVEDKLPELELKPQQIEKYMQLLAVEEPVSGKTYAVLILNA